MGPALSAIGVVALLLGISSADAAVIQRLRAYTSFSPCGLYDRMDERRYRGPHRDSSKWSMGCDGRTQKAKPLSRLNQRVALSITAGFTQTWLGRSPCLNKKPKYPVRDHRLELIK